jgi:hypothetical protein
VRVAGQRCTTRRDFMKVVCRNMLLTCRWRAAGLPRIYRRRSRFGISPRTVGRLNQADERQGIPKAHNLLRHMHFRLRQRRLAMRRRHGAQSADRFAVVLNYARCPYQNRRTNHTQLWYCYGRILAESHTRYRRLRCRQNYNDNTARQFWYGLGNILY